MNKLVNVFIFIFCIQFSFAQSIQVTGGDYFNSDMTTDITHHLDLKNNSSNTITVVCQKTIISMPNNLPIWGGASYCFAGNCYSATSTLPSSPAILSPGQEIKYSNSDLEAFSGYYVPAQVAGVSVVEYCFYDENNPSDETCVTVTYEISSSTEVNEIDRISQFYPNPAIDFTNFIYKDNVPAQLRVIDILGNHVKTEFLDGSNISRISTLGMSEGIYFGNLIVDEQLVDVYKLIIKK